MSWTAEEWMEDLRGAKWTHVVRLARSVGVEIDGAETADRGATAEKIAKILTRPVEK